VNLKVGVLVIIEARTPQTFVIKRKCQRFDQMQVTARIGAQAYDITGVGWNFRLIEDDVKQELSSKRELA